MFGNLIPTVDTNTQFHSKPYAFGIHAKINIKNQFLGEMHKFRVSSISLCLVGEMA